MLSENEFLELGRKLTNKYIKDNISDIPQDLYGGTLIEKLYNYFHKEPHVCATCGAPTKFISFSKGYRQYCSVQCQIKQRAEKTRKTCLKKYGRLYPKNIEKSKQTCLERYGVEHASQAELVKQKARQTCLERYGRATGLNAEKSKQTCLERYGVEHASQIPGSRPHKPKLVRHVPGYNNREKAQATCMERYGVPNATQVPEIRQKMASTCIERYGADVYVKAKAMDNNPDIISSSGGTWTCKCPHQECNKCEARTYETTSSLYNDRARRGAELCTILMPVQSLYSSHELKVRSWLDSTGIIYDSNDRTIIAPKELDIYIPELKIAIEINGCYWHSVDEKPKHYHIDKWNRCAAKGILLISLWEDWVRDDFDSVVNLLQHHIYGTDYTGSWDHNLVDLGLGSGEIKEHLSDHDGFKCWDSGIFVSDH